MLSREPSAITQLSRVAVFIPAWQPGPELVSLIEGLASYGFGALLVVDDGSSPASHSIFAAIASEFGVTILRHAVNLGKGRALKTGFNHILTHLPDVQTVVTADADGQHTVTDIVAVAHAACASPMQLVLGARNFGVEVPLRSKFGNVLTRNIFRLVTGAKLTDTQTGLRAIPRIRLIELMPLEGERYEYEMTMLARLCRGGERPLQVPIVTVYIDGNRSSHFDPVRDSMRIYFVLARFYFSSLLAAGIDLVVFSLAFAATGNLLLSVAIGRLSSLVNFAINRRFVFNSRDHVVAALGRYYLLAGIIAGLSYLLIRGTVIHLHWNVLAAKIVVDVLLSLISFSAQRTLVFFRSRQA
jgi:glycosyltransferase involved in cell wall biosynthesis